MPWANDREARRRSSVTYGALWRKKRLECLKRAKWKCQIRLEGFCIGAATEVDHIRGAANDPEHRWLRAACAPCHAQVTAQQGNDAKRGSGGKDPEWVPRMDW